MREFRILGPLEALLDGSPVDLGGQRQRALLAALLVHHGQVVSTDRLVDLLWGEQAPKTATTSLQNAVSQLRRELGADVVETRAPGYIFAADPAAIDAVRFETLLGQARGRTAAERAQLLRSALALWRGPALADLAGEEFTQGEIRRLEELRLDALEERIAADIELGLHREVIGELETLAAATPLRERVCALRMLALYRSGRQAEALQAFRETRSAFVDELGIEPGAELQELHARILRQEAGLAAAGNGKVAGEVESEILRALLSGRVVPVLGLAAAEELARRLGESFDVPASVRGSARPRHAVRGCDAGARTVARRAPRHLRSRRGAAPGSSAAGPPSRSPSRARCSAPGHRDDGLRPLRRARVRRRGRGAGRRHLHRRGPAARQVPPLSAGCRAPHGGRAERLRRPLAGAANGPPPPPRPGRRRAPTGSWESLVVTEDDHIDYPGPGDLEAVIPVTLDRPAAAKPLPLPRLRPRRLEPPAHRGPAPRRACGGVRLLGRVRRALGARAGVLAPPRRPGRRGRRERLREPARRATRRDGDRVSGQLPRSPYKGLAPFADTAIDAMLFFGRERDVEIVCANVVASRLTVLYGPSGVGKSSLLAAAVARWLRELPEQPVVVVFSAWSESPAAAIAQAVAAEAGIDADGTLAEVVERACEVRGEVYLLLDQVEEYFLYHPASGPLEQELAVVLRGRTRANVLLSLREDALAKLDRFKAPIPGILDNYLRLDRLSREAGRAAVVRPLARWHELGGDPVEIEPELAEAVLDQVAAGRIRAGLGGSGTGRRRRGRGADRGAVPPARAGADLGRRAGAGIVDAAPLDAGSARWRGPDRGRPPRARDGSAHPGPAGDRVGAVPAARDALRCEDRARRGRPRRVRGRAGGGGTARPRDAGGPADPAAGRRRALRDLPRRPRCPDPRLAWAPRPCAGAGRGAPAEPPARW